MFASNIKGEGGPLPAKEILQYSEIETWDAFKGMVNIQKLDFVSLHAKCTPYLLECHPVSSPQLFCPFVRTIRISTCFGDPLFR